MISVFKLIFMKSDIIIYMVDYVLARKSRNIASSFVHVFLNLLLGIGAVLITVLSNSPLLGILLVLVSKWRVFAVRLRYIWLNIKANLVDLIVGLSVVLISFYAGNDFLPVHVLLALFYSVWLIIIKPLSNDLATAVQSAIAVFLGTTACVMMTSELDSIVLILLEFLIGYACSRHVLSQSEDKNYTLTTFVCGLIFAEIAWLCNSWSIVYTFGSTGIRIPQVSLILTIFVFVYNRVRQATIKYQDDFRFKHILAPVLFGGIIISIIVLLFSNPIFNI